MGGVGGGRLNNISVTMLFSASPANYEPVHSPAFTCSFSFSDEVISPLYRKGWLCVHLLTKHLEFSSSQDSTKFRARYTDIARRQLMNSNMDDEACGTLVLMLGMPR